MVKTKQTPSRKKAGEALAQAGIIAHALRNGGDQRDLSRQLDAALIVLMEHLRFRKSTMREAAMRLQVVAK